MKALSWTAQDHVKVIDAPEPKITESDVLIELIATGVCGSDVHAYMGKHRFRVPPVVLGHEVVGRVKEIGAEVDSISIGDVVTVMPVRSCRRCRECRSGNSHLCAHRSVPGTKEWPGTFATYFVAPADLVLKLPPLPAEVSAMIEPLAVAVHATNRAGNLKHKTVNVIGAGAIGHMIGIAARYKGASRIACMDPDPLALELASKNGFVALQPGDESRLPMADVTFVTANYAKSLDDAIERTMVAGTIVLVSMYEGQIPVDIYAAIFNEMDIKGSMLYSMDDFREAIRIAQSTQDSLKRIVGPSIRFEQAPDLFRNLSKGKRGALKTLIVSG